jgi:hypothetical protein
MARDDSSFPMEPVESSNLASVGYNGKTKELYVTFKSSGNYVYKDVPAKDAVGLLYSSSKGKFLNAVIKPNYGYSKR